MWHLLFIINLSEHFDSLFDDGRKNFFNQKREVNFLPFLFYFSDCGFWDMMFCCGFSLLIGGFDTARTCWRQWLIRDNYNFCRLTFNLKSLFELPFKTFHSLMIAAAGKSYQAHSNRDDDFWRNELIQSYAQPEFSFLYHRFIAFLFDNIFFSFS